MPSPVLDYLDKIELAVNVQVGEQNTYALYLEYKGLTIPVAVTYTPETGVLWWQHVLRHGRIKSASVGSMIRQFYAKRGRFIFVWPEADENGLYINCAVTIHAAQYQLGLAKSRPFISEHLNSSAAKFCMDVADMYREVSGDPTIFHDYNEIGHA